jgi:hypothetical protein
MKRLVTTVCLAAFCLVFARAAVAQNTTSGAIQGTVIDQTDKAVVGATVTITNKATGVTLPPSKTGNAGDYATAAAPGVYTIEISMTGFKTAKVENVEVVVGKTYNVQTKLEIGAAAESVTVEAGGRQLLETTNTAVENLVTGRAITDMPYPTRNAVLMGTLDPGAQTVGGERNSTFQGLPKGTINITFDGINTQDNSLKSSDGFFSLITPEIDDVAEFGITTGANDPSKSGEGAVQMNYVSKGGGNAFHGGVWYYNRNTDFNANYYFNNLNGLPRATLKLNEFGYKVGGPILKNKLFFFTDFDFFQFPQSLTRSRTLLTGTPGSGTGAANGFFPYVPAVGSDPSTAAAGTLTCTNLTAGLTTASSVCTSNLLALAAATTSPNTPANVNNGTFYPSVINPVILPYLTAISHVLTVPGVSTSIAPSLWQNAITYNAAATQVRRYPDVRFDYNITKKQSLELDYHYAFYNGTPDLLNGEDAVFPIAPFNSGPSGGSGGQLSNRNLFVIAWRWAIDANKSNELRWGLQTAPVIFALGVPTTSLLPSINTNQGPVPYYTFGIAGTSGPFLSPNSSGRNSATAQIHETFQWTKGTHQFTFGGDATGIWYNDYGLISGNVNFGIDGTNDPTTGNMFTGGQTSGGAPINGNLSGINPNDIGSAESLYASLVGRVTSWSDSVAWSPKTNNFLTGAPTVTRIRQNEFGVYGNDSWRVRPTLTFNFGLRWEYQGAPYDTYNEFFMMSSFNNVWGVSGPGNLFKPGVIGGVGANFFNDGNSGISYQNDKGLSFYNKYYKALAPSVGLAWQPSLDWKVWKMVFGSAGKTVLRAGYSISYSRQGLDDTFSGIIQSNGGYTGAQFMQDTSFGSPLSPGNFNAGSITLGGTLPCNPGNPNCVLQTPTSFVPTFALDPNAGQSVNVFAPNLEPPRIQSWQVGIQRELGHDMALEIRYQGNHGTGLWDQFDLNEVNIFENGFLNEFNNATANLAICQTNAVACKAAQALAGVSVGHQTTNNYADWGLTGQMPLPIMTAAFTGSKVGPQTSSLFRNGTFLQAINNHGAGSYAAFLANYFNGFLGNMVGAGFPINFFTANPLATGDSFVLCNCAQSTYNALVVDFRRRFSHGIQFDANYVFARSLTDYNVNSAVSYQQFTTLRNTAYDKGPAPFDIRQALKVQGIWDLPFGEGRKWSSSSRILNRIIGGWSFNSVTRWQTGQPVQIYGGVSNGDTFNFNNGATFVNDSGVNLVGITKSQLQSMLQVNKTQQAGAVWYVPTNLLNAATGRANTAIIQPCNVAGTLCPKLFVYGPPFFEADWTIAKTTKITEHVNFEMRMEALNAFNNQNFYWGSGPGSSPALVSTQSTRFGQMGSNASNGAYTDPNTTFFPGGRVVQLVGRVNF